MLTIEADGASYHSAPTARDRDRLRQQALEAKGWRFHRIWSTEWFRNREVELDKAEQAWMLAVETAMRDEVPTDFEPSRGVKSDLEVQSNQPSQRARSHKFHGGEWEVTTAIPITATLNLRAWSVGSSPIPSCGQTKT